MSLRLEEAVSMFAGRSFGDCFIDAKAEALCWRFKQESKAFAFIKMWDNSETCPVLIRYGLDEFNGDVCEITYRDWVGHCMPHFVEFMDYHFPKEASDATPNTNQLP